jgi:hypothetical protein
MKNRNIVAVLSALVGFVLCQQMPAQETPDPGSVGGSFNTADGTNALGSVTTGVANSAFGWFSLFSNTDGSFNTALGAGTLLFNVGDQSTGEGTRNTAIGTAALLLNVKGSGNTAVGVAALLNNTDGLNNNAVGGFALNANTSGQFNNAHGNNALQNNVNGSGNSAFGDVALAFNLSGSANTAIGEGALVNCTGDFNVGLGELAGADITTGSNIIAIGEGVSGVSTVGGEVNDSCYIGNIHNAPIDPLTAQTVYVDADGKLGSMSFSSERFKKDIKLMGQSSQAVLALKPVTFKYKNYKEDAPQFGLIAEQVAQVNTDLVVHDKNGEAMAVRYDAVTAMLLNEFLREYRKVQKQQREIDSLKSELKEQRFLIQKISAQVELSKPSPKTVLNDRDAGQ